MPQQRAHDQDAAARREVDRLTDALDGRGEPFELGARQHAGQERIAVGFECESHPVVETAMRVRYPEGGAMADA